ncbi:MAG TPA: hypothetical protein VEW28_05930, partial [Candidatus Kapabacteria bacterium]|nr:hypothetical protein [Candidatus Kapabacteria bacterium]
MKKQLIVAVTILLLLCAAGSRAQMMPITQTSHFDDRPQIPYQSFINESEFTMSLTTGIIGSEIAHMWLFAADPKETMTPYGLPSFHSASSTAVSFSGSIAGAFLGDQIAKKKNLSPLEGMVTSGAMGFGMFIGGNLGAAVGGVPVYYKFSFGDVSSMKSRAPLYYAAVAGTIGAVAAGMAVLSLIGDDGSSLVKPVSKVQFDINPGTLAQYALRQPSPNQTKIASLRYSW